MIIVFDAESDSLYGEIFSVGAVVLSRHGEIMHKFYERSEYEPENEWVKANVLPHLDPPTCLNYYELTQKFWNWVKPKFRQHEVWADGAFPIECKLMRDCVSLYSEDHMADSPYPLNEAMTLFKVKGIDPDIDRMQFLAKLDNWPGKIRKHNPTDDAYISGLCILELL